MERLLGGCRRKIIDSGDHTMASDTSLTVPTRYVAHGGIRFAYRRWGKPGGVPLVFLNYFGGNLDDWDPQVTDGLAADYEVILFDNAGVASSGGETPGTIPGMARDVLAFCDALGLKKINVVGFSLGGMIAQQMAIDHPDRLGRIILLGTGPRGGEGMTFTELSADERADPVQFLLAAFFSPSDASHAAGRAYLDRLAARTRDRDKLVSPKTAEAQLRAIRDGERCRRATATPRCRRSSTQPLSCTAPRISWSSRSTPSSSRNI